MQGRLIASHSPPLSGADALFPPSTYPKVTVASGWQATPSNGECSPLSTEHAVSHEACTSSLRTRRNAKTKHIATMNQRMLPAVALIRCRRAKCPHSTCRPSMVGNPLWCPSRSFISQNENHLEKTMARRDINRRGSRVKSPVDGSIRNGGKTTASE